MSNPQSQPSNDSGLPAATLTLQRYCGYKGLLQLNERWLDLVRSLHRPHFNHHPAWFRAHFERSDARDDAIDFFAVSRGAFLVAVFPFSRRLHHGFLRRAGLPFHQSIFITDCCIADSEDKAEVWQFFKQAAQAIPGGGWDVFLAAGGGHLTTSHMYGCLETTGPLRIRSPHGSTCGFLDIQPYDEIQRDLKPRFRSNLRRSHKLLATRGTPRFVPHTDPAAVSDAFECFVQLELSGWKGNPSASKAGYSGPSAIGLSDWKYRFFKRLIADMAEYGHTEICLLYAGEHLVGGLISLTMNSTAYLMKITYDETAREISAGHLLIENALQRWADRGDIETISLLSTYPWLRSWNPRPETYYSIVDFRPTLGGIASCIRRRLGDGLQKLKAGRETESG